jgi:hypothetical protein
MARRRKSFRRGAECFLRSKETKIGTTNFYRRLFAEFTNCLTKILRTFLRFSRVKVRLHWRRFFGEKRGHFNHPSLALLAMVTIGGTTHLEMSLSVLLSPKILLFFTDLYIFRLKVYLHVSPISH